MLQLRIPLTFLIVFCLFHIHKEIYPATKASFSWCDYENTHPLFKTPYWVHCLCLMKCKMRVDYEEDLLSLLESRFCNCFLCDWLKIFTPLCRPISSKNKGWLTYVFPRLSRPYVIYSIVWAYCDWPGLAWCHSIKTFRNVSFVPDQNRSSLQIWTFGEIQPAPQVTTFTNK